MYFQVLLLSVLAVGGVMAVKGFDDNFINFSMKASTCVSESGNPSLCKKFIGCTRKLPKPVKAVYDDCKNSVYPDGLGSCKDGDSLFKSEDDQKKFEQCFLKELPQYKSLDSHEDKAQEHFVKCIKKDKINKKSDLECVAKEASSPYDSSCHDINSKISDCISKLLCWNPNRGNQDFC
ncbi:uncharacterized protein TNIN_287271 [Trichonephila inaurata madagascariensis]|uniref:Uncharacterized protein n=1 Tax=Trichonephila inaurata madagascariensis TaxID=2747483 RepID=A0A8X6XR73_9ARAC|nr:uncharacterized protein TNIN_287271 [Trichonephila inaurata madagascariensis]